MRHKSIRINIPNPNRNNANQPRPPVRNKTRKTNTPSKNNAIMTMYNNDYYGTELLPMTDILNYINDGFKNFVIEKERKKKENEHEVDFGDFFIVDDILKKKEKIANINIVIKKNPNMSLNKILAYSLYLQSFSWFQNGIMNISSFKYQIGKDVSRAEVKINNELLVIPENDYGNNILITDKFIIKIMNVLSKFTIIDFDLVNKIGILMCQNLFNFITQTISLMTRHKIEPEISAETKATKNILINLTQNDQSIIFNFKSLLIISYNEDLNPENTCGNLDFSLLIDLKKNTYKFTKFILNYDIEKCKPDNEDEIDNEVENKENKENNENNENKDKGNSNMIKYGIPMGIITTGLLATPFLLGALGGKHNKKLKGKSIKSIKRIKSIKSIKKRKNKKVKRKSKK